MEWSVGHFTGASSTLLLSFVLLFVASHTIEQGAVIWVFAAIITLITPIFLDADSGIFKDNPWPIFIFFAGMMVLQLLFVIFMMPETKGVSLEELSKKLSSKEYPEKFQLKHNLTIK